jgi:aspartyl-tRNA synthetase
MYRTNKCAEVNKSFLDKKVKVSGWIRKKRNHGNIIFLDLLDSSGILQCVIENDNKFFSSLDGLNLESVVSLSGLVVNRENGKVNKEIESGDVELKIEGVEILSRAETLPFALHQEDISVKQQSEFRFLYLRRPEMQAMLKKRTQVIDEFRSAMKSKGFHEIQTPILTASSKEGARDYLVPSRLHPCKFYALPQAPQQFKQLLMVSGVDKYFQIAPCFRDEDSRADRLVGEFYQVDFEVSFATQDDIFEYLEGVLKQVFETVRPEVKISAFEKIKYDDAIKTYGSDKPDLRNPLKLQDVTNDAEVPNVFKSLVEAGGKLIIIKASGCYGNPRKFFDALHERAIYHGAKGLAYAFKGETWSGPLAKMYSDSFKDSLCENDEDGIFMLAGMPHEVYKIAGLMRDEIANSLCLVDKGDFKFAFISDFPMFEKVETEDGTGWDFMHNPFSMPRLSVAEMQKLDEKSDLSQISSFQYDVVCNGYEICSGAVRNHDLGLIESLFALIGKDLQAVYDSIPLFKAFKFGVPPHAGAAIGLDRVVMLLSDAKNVRDIVAFPLNQQGEDLFMNAPCFVDEEDLEKHLCLKLKPRRV